MTTNKNFIWSCSEHEIAAINNYDQEKRTTKKAFEYQTTERAIEMI
ncbi:MULTISPECIES: hypothetical protein [Lacinutrix]|nr:MULTISPECIES: hypothetical protein [Lacinutrix]